MKRVIQTLACCCILLATSTAHAASDVVPTVSIGVFFEFGDEAGFAGGFDVWAGAAMYPLLDDPAADGATLMVAAGLQLRTGMIPLLTGPNQISPQLRTGIAWLGGVGHLTRDTEFKNQAFSNAKLYAITGYRWAFEFGLDNLKRKRKDENAFRFGIGSVVPLIPDTLEVPMLNGVDVLGDVNLDGSFDRFGFSVFAGF